MKIHTLSNGATLVSLSPHPFRFSDGTESEPQDKDFVNLFTLRREEVFMGEIKGMSVNRTRMVIDSAQAERLLQIANEVDIVLVPLPLLLALRDDYHWRVLNIVAMNATVETQRSSPDLKVVDINNWSGC